MPVGIGLGLPDDPASLDNVRYYAIEPRSEGIAWDRVGANPFAATVNSSGAYDRVDTFNEWVQEDWQAGVGRVDPEEGGFLFAESETRVPNQVILPPKLQIADRREVTGTAEDCRYIPDNVAGTFTVGSGGHEKVAIAFTTPSSFNSAITVSFYVYARVDDGVEVELAVYSEVSNNPGTEIVDTSFFGVVPDRMFRWYGFIVDISTLSTSTTYFLTVNPVSASDTIEIAYGTSGYNTNTKTHNGTSWSTQTGQYLLHYISMHALNSLPTDAGFKRFNGTLYHALTGTLYEYVSADNNFVSTTSDIETGLRSLEVFGPNLYVGYFSGNYEVMSTSEVISDGGAAGRLLLQFKGLLYRTVGNNLYYSADASTWVGPFAAGGSDVAIRGIAGLGDSVYCATDKALVRFAPGDVMEEVSRFGAENDANGVGMIEYQGAIYVPAAGRIFRMDASGQLQDIWINREDDLAARRVGEVVDLVSMNNWLVAFTAPVEDYAFGTLWLYQAEGWHFLASTPQLRDQFTEFNCKLYYDRGTSRLWFSSLGVGPFYLEIPDYTLNPFNLSGYKYMPHGWLEQDRFYGGQRLLDKSWESVTPDGENITSSTPVDVYFQDEGSTEWELLGTATNEGQELRWSDYSTRPSGKWIKLAVRLRTTDGDETPRVRAIVVKFLPYPFDRVRDTVTLTLKSNAELTGGTVSPYTLAEQRTHIESLIASVDPFIYVDPLGDSYEVTLVDWNMSASKWDVSGAVTELRVMLVLEQIQNAKYL